MTFTNIDLKFKGEEGYALFGLIAGLAGASMFLVLKKAATGVVPEPISFAVSLTIVILFLTSMVIKFSSIFTHRAIITLNIDDLILGFALGFDIPLVGIELLSGHLPFVE
jgi:hypothetical protein